MTRSLRVGDVVRVGRSINRLPADSLAVVVEVYQRDRYPDARPGVTLLFSDGFADGFSAEDCALWRCAPVGHVANLAGYVFTSIMTLTEDYRRGLFSEVWRAD